MAEIRVFRKGGPGPKWNPAQYDRKPTKADRERAEMVRYATARVARPGLVEWAEAGGFYDLPAIEVADVKYLWLEGELDNGWTVPDTDLGRAGSIDRSTVQSIVLWVKKNLAHCINPAHLSVVIVDDKYL